MLLGYSKNTDRGRTKSCSLGFKILPAYHFCKTSFKREITSIVSPISLESFLIALECAESVCTATSKSLLAGMSTFISTSALVYDRIAAIKARTLPSTLGELKEDDGCFRFTSLCFLASTRRFFAIFIPRLRCSAVSTSAEIDVNFICTNTIFFYHSHIKLAMSTAFINAALISLALSL